MQLTHMPLPYLWSKMDDCALLHSSLRRYIVRVCWHVV